MGKFWKRMFRTAHTEKLVKQSRISHDKDVAKTSASINKATKTLENGVTIKIYKAVHHGR